mmetsp:Transcript_4881/g.8910  ORF Transcript_4881/g.8910 Transcript_4881/m.8910 type:complete len:237 (+) Transcript_4881:269-979(+)
MILMDEMTIVSATGPLICTTTILICTTTIPMCTIPTSIPVLLVAVLSEHYFYAEFVYGAPECIVWYALSRRQGKIRLRRSVALCQPSFYRRSLVRVSVLADDRVLHDFLCDGASEAHASDFMLQVRNRRDLRHRFTAPAFISFMMQRAVCRTSRPATQIRTRTRSGSGSRLRLKPLRERHIPDHVHANHHACNRDADLSDEFVVNEFVVNGIVLCCSCCLCSLVAVLSSECMLSMI